jgi:hypothetical protein
MADAPQKSPWSLIAMVGISDMVLGVALAVSSLTGFLDVDRTIVPIVGGVMAVSGGAVFVWARERAGREAGQ